MTELADAVLPLIRTRSDLHRWSASNRHGSQMHDAVDLLQGARATGTDPKDILDVTQRAVASSLKIIMRDDDSSGIIGGAIGNNCIDRVRFGAVVDFLDFGGLHFPWVFNVADSAISIGVVLLLLDSLLHREAPSGPG